MMDPSRTKVQGKCGSALSAGRTICVTSLVDGPLPSRLGIQTLYEIAVRRIFAPCEGEKKCRCGDSEAPHASPSLLTTVEALPPAVECNFLE